SRRNPSRATGPFAVRSIYARAEGSNFGHRGSEPPFGFPVLAKLVQYCCIWLDTVSSVASKRGAFGDWAAIERVPNTYGSSLPCAAPTFSLPGGTREN